MNDGGHRSDRLLRAERGATSAAHTCPATAMTLAATAAAATTNRKRPLRRAGRASSRPAPVDAGIARGDIAVIRLPVVPEAERLAEGVAELLRAGESPGDIA